MKTLDQILQELSPAERQQNDRTLEALRKSLPLGAVRRQFNRTQAFVASKLGITQAAVSQMEARGDVLLSTLFDVVEAVGGRASIRVDGDGVRARIVGHKEDGDWSFEVSECERVSADMVTYKSGDMRFRSQGLVALPPAAIAANDDHVAVVRPHAQVMTIRVATVGG